MSHKDTIKIYAPTDCYVGELKELQDGVFSEGMLGLGIYIEPENNKFNSPVEGKCVQIFHTKHAIHFEDVNGNILLMHIGLDTVHLNGEPFTLKIKSNQIVNKSTNVVDVDLKLLEDKKVRKSTPLVIEEQENYDYKFLNFRSGDFKQGDLILEVEKLPKEVSTQKIDAKKDDKGHVLPSTFQNKWENLSSEILKGVVDKENILSINNCNTRLRLNIKDLTKINMDEVNQNKIVKGFQIQGNELQIIIGPDAYKLKETFSDFINRPVDYAPLRAQHVPFKSKVIKVVNGILVPVVPIIVAASMITLIKSVLEVTGAIEQVNIGFNEGIWTVLTDYDLFTGLLYIFAQTAFAFVGIYFTYSTVKFLKGNEMIGLLIGITLACPFLWGGQRWEIFNLGSFTFTVTAYTSSIIPHIFAGVVFVNFDRWCRKWVPIAVDLIVRNTLGYIVTVLMVFLVAGPFLVLLEKGLYFAIIDGLGKIPGGIGVGIFGLLWQPLVVTGMHTAFYIPMDQQIGSGIPSALALVKQITPLAQFGAGMAVLILTKNSATRQIAVGAAPTAFLGITEPIIYGINLVKVTPFIAACIGSGIAGLYYGITNTQLHAIGNGILAIIGTLGGGAWNVASCVIGIIIAVSSSFVITLLIYHERIDERRGINSLYKKLEKLFKKNIEIKLNFKEETEKINSIYSKETREQINKLELLLYKKGILENKVEAAILKEESVKAKLYNKALKAYQKEDDESVLKYNEQLENFSINKDELYNKMSVITKEIISLNGTYNVKCLEVQDITNNVVDQIVTETKDKSFETLKNNFKEIIMSLENNVLTMPKDKQEIELFNFKKYRKMQKAALTQ